MIAQKNFFSLFKKADFIILFCLTLTSPLFSASEAKQKKDRQALVCVTGDLLYNKNYERNLITFVSQVINISAEHDKIPDLITLEKLLSSRTFNIPLKLILDALVDAAHVIRISYCGGGTSIDIDRLTDVLEYWCNFATKQMLSVNDTFYRNDQ